jgi:hypothetical protein
MNIKLEELRKRLLEPVATPAGPSTSGYRRNSLKPYADHPRSTEPDDSAAHQQPSTEAVFFWGRRMNIKLEQSPKSPVEPVATPAGPSTSECGRGSHELYADQPREPDDARQRRSVEAVAPEPPPAPQRPNSVSGSVLQYMQQAAASSTEGESIEQQNGQYQLAQAVAKVFEQTKTFQDEFAEMATVFEPIERIGKAAAHSFEPLRSLEQQLVQLAHSFEPMRAFQIQLVQLAQNYEAVKGLHEQFAQLSEAFHIHLDRLANSLQPAREFQLELLKLARAFDPATDLQAQFAQLAETFKGTPATANGNNAGPAKTSVEH